MDRTGGCLCGQVRYRLVGEPFAAGLCHCADCRKESGSAFVAFARWPIGAFSYTGTVATFAGRSFCPSCGGRLFNLHEDDVEIRLGSLDDAPNGITPHEEGWTRRREPWIHAVPGAGQYEEDPP